MSERLQPGVSLLLDFQIKRPFLDPRFPQNQADPWLLLSEGSGLGAQKAKLIHFKPFPVRPICDSTIGGYFRVTIRRDGVEQWDGSFKSLGLLVCWPAWPTVSPWCPPGAPLEAWGSLVTEKQPSPVGRVYPIGSSCLL